VIVPCLTCAGNSTLLVENLTSGSRGVRIVDVDGSGKERIGSGRDSYGVNPTLDLINPILIKYCGHRRGGIKK